MLGVTIMTIMNVKTTEWVWVNIKDANCRLW